MEHLAVMQGDYLDKILKGEKTIESRFSKHRCAPFGAVTSGDEILFKPAGGPVIAQAGVERVLYFEQLTPAKLKEITHRFRTQLQLSQEFIKSRQEARYCTLIFLQDVRRVTPRFIEKRDRRGWVPLNNGQLTLWSKGTPVQNARTQASRAHSKAVHALALRDYNNAKLLLRTNEWREQWWTKQLDDDAIRKAQDKNSEQIQAQAQRRLLSSVAIIPTKAANRLPYRDGYQTPFTGNILFYAQHALALCCRKCIKDWYDIPLHRDFTPEEIIEATTLLTTYIAERLHNYRGNE